MEGIVLQNVSLDDYNQMRKDLVDIKKSLSEFIDKKRNEKISVQEASDEANVSSITMYRWIQEGKVKASKIGRKILIKRTDLEDALSEVKSSKYKR